MKKLILILLIPLLFSGCLKRDSMEDITIYTTIYPIEYVTNRLYGEYSKINSIYPSGVNIKLKDCKDNCDEQYTLTEKQLSDYSMGNLFIFNSILYEGNYVNEMFKINNKLKIINATDSINIDDLYGLEELWLDPSRLTTLARKIKNGFNEYINNYYLKQELETNFNELKEELDKLEAKLADIIKKSDQKTIVVDDDVFKYLSKDKYGLTVYSLEENDNLNSKIIEEVKQLIKNGQINYIFTKQYNEVNKTVESLIEGTNVKIVTLHTITNLTENEISEKKDYFTLMNENIESIKKELYE